MSKTKIITGLDIGSDAIKLLVAQKNFQDSSLEILTYLEENSTGIRRGIVINPDEVSIILQKLFEKIKEQTGKKINSVFVNINGSHIFSTNSRGLVSVSRADQKISSEDINRVLQAAQTLSLPSNRQILEIFPKEFIVDGEKGIKEPLGLRGIRLEAETLIIGGFIQYIQNLTNAVLNSGIQKIDNLIISPIAAAKAALTQKEKELGVVLLDIGTGCTGIVVYKEGELIHLSVLPIGSGHITNDIALFLKSDIDIAEKIKIDYGTLLFHGNDKKEKIKLADGEFLTFSIKHLSKIIEDRVLEIFRETNKELKKISQYGSLPAGVVLTGGGAKIPKIKELAKKEFKLFCRIAKPNNKIFSSIQNDPKLTTICGLILSSEDLTKEDFSDEGIGIKIKNFFKIFIP